MKGMSDQQLTDLGAVKHACLTYVLHDIMIVGPQDGAVKATHCQWLTYFYEDSVYDPTDKVKGLFCGNIPWCVYTHLFTRSSAPSTGSIVSNTSKQLKNHAWGLHEVTPQIIAYVHVVSYFTLSTAPRWTANVSQMDLSALMWWIIEMFNTTMFNELDSWAKETLAWWNS
ncbi:hypothetical protein V8B97DRAFT_2025225 [Scleroderma yunnanense]